MSKESNPTPRKLIITIELDVTGGPDMRRGMNNNKLRDGIADPLLQNAAALARQEANLVANDTSSCRVQFVYGDLYNASVTLADTEELVDIDTPLSFSGADL